jgi:hypothetical protein
MLASDWDMAPRTLSRHSWFSKDEEWDGLTGLRIYLRSSTRACARVARYSPGYHITGFQPFLSGFVRGTQKGRIGGLFLDPISLIGNGFRECCRCCRRVADLLPTKLLMDNNVADVADFRSAMQFSSSAERGVRNAE